MHFVDGMDKTTDFDRHFYLNALLTSSYPQGVFCTEPEWIRLGRPIWISSINISSNQETKETRYNMQRIILKLFCFFTEVSRKENFQWIYNQFCFVQRLKLNIWLNLLSRCSKKTRFTMRKILLWFCLQCKICRPRLDTLATERMDRKGEMLPGCIDNRFGCPSYYFHLDDDIK